MAEQYMGRSKADVKQMQEDIYLKDAIIAGLERYVQELVEKQREVVKVTSNPLTATADEGEVVSSAPTVQRQVIEPSPTPATTARGVSDSCATSTRVVGAADMDAGGPKVKYETHPTAHPIGFNANDYLADIYDACTRDSRSINSAARLRASAVADLKPFDGRQRDEFKGKSWLSTVRAAFRRDQLTPVRADWGRLQAEFELEYCGATVTPQQRYFEMRRRSSEEPVDYLYRLNVQAREASIALPAS
ncbi:hypothetical protein ATCC90586_011611 [Pythium insidiosum]|nr:hypothetical protein ATCC90586_011611 [Pythium insidiosum]